MFQVNRRLKQFLPILVSTFVFIPLLHSARYFRPYERGKAAADLVDEKFPAYNFDIAEGVTYDLDISQSAGQRIQNLRFHGRAVLPDEKFRLATNNYRVTGVVVTPCTTRRRWSIAPVKKYAN